MNNKHFIVINPLTFHHRKSRLKIAFYVTKYGYENAKGLINTLASEHPILEEKQMSHFVLKMLKKLSYKNSCINFDTFSRRNGLFIFRLKNVFAS